MTAQQIFEDAVAYRFKSGQSREAIARLYRASLRAVDKALRNYMNRRRGR